MSHPVEDFLRTVREVRDAGGVAETSFYPAIASLLDAAGARLQPRVRCIIHPQNRGAGIPDGGLFTADQMGLGERALLDDADAVPATLPARGALEVKAPSASAARVAESEQVERYLGRYGQVLVTNLREWVLVGRGAEGAAQVLEEFRLAPGEGALWEMARHPRRGADAQGDALMDFLRLVMLRPAPITDPADVAWVLATYAREARTRAESVDLPALAALREALEEALGMHFHGTRGEHFFRSTLVQTLFYGVFSAWVLWSRQTAEPGARFDWRTAGWTLRVPAIRALFHQITDPDRLFRLGLVGPLDRAADALNRVDRATFFRAFREEHAVQYFYEPFLQAFDPELRKELGVWYTPPEIVTYMVERVDRSLREELGIADGLADPRVLVLDPCCGTGAYLVGVLDRIARTLRERGEESLLAAELRKAATERVFGFEILPAPFVVAHLQMGLLLRSYGAAGNGDDGEGGRVGVFLTNALTGWGPPPDEQKTLAFPELRAEHDAAERVKRAESVLVVLGNPPYNGFPGAAMEEERDLVEAYRTTRRAPKPQGQGLNDLYVRFFRMAERRIVEMTGKGIVCFISNYSWLDGLSFTGMRERYLDVFDRIWIDSLNGDKFRTGKRTPEGDPDPSVFSTDWNREGIGVGTGISMLVRTIPHLEDCHLHYRSFWGVSKREDLLRSVREHESALYRQLDPDVRLGLLFTPIRAVTDYLEWPKVPELFHSFWSGVNTSRDSDLVEIDQQVLQSRMLRYFDETIDMESLKAYAPSLAQSRGRFDAGATRRYLLTKSIESGSLIRYAYRPFDIRFVYWHSDTKLLDERREELFRAIGPGNMFLTCRQKAERHWEGTPFVATQYLPDRHLTRPGSVCFPIYVTGGKEQQDLLDPSTPHANVSQRGKAYLAALGIEDLSPGKPTADLIWMIVLATGHTPAYLDENRDTIQQNWPRIPLPAARVRLEASAALGRELAVLLDPEQPAPGVTTGSVRTELRPLAVPARADGGQLDPARDFALSAGWGHAGKGGATMPGRGRAVERAYTDEERGVLEAGAAERETSADQLYALLGETCYDVWLNDRAYWRCVPSRVWEYTLGGYQVIKKWLSYREAPLLGRPLRLEEVREVSHIARRIAAILLMEPALNDAYAATKADVWPWGGQDTA
jgi:hypothetical protein